VAFVEDTVLWVDARETDGDFGSHEVPQSTKFTLQSLTTTPQFDMVLGETDEGMIVLFLVDRDDNYAYGLNLTEPSTSEWGMCPL
jgi:hypothetical protein